MKSSVATPSLPAYYYYYYYYYYSLTPTKPRHERAHRLAPTPSLLQRLGDADVGVGRQLCLDGCGARRRMGSIAAVPTQREDRHVSQRVRDDVRRRQVRVRARRHHVLERVLPDADEPRRFVLAIGALEDGPGLFGFEKGAEPALGRGEPAPELDLSQPLEQLLESSKRRAEASQLDAWLERRGLGKYRAAIAELGARKVSDLAHLEQGDLDDMGMTPYERADVRISVG